MRGVGIKELVRRTGLSRNTVRAALRSAEPPVFKVPQRPSKLEPFKDEIHRLLRTTRSFRGVRVRELIEPLGFDGGKSIVDGHRDRTHPAVNSDGQRDHQLSQRGRGQHTPSSRSLETRSGCHSHNLDVSAPSLHKFSTSSARQSIVS